MRYSKIICTKNAAKNFQASRAFPNSARAKIIITGLLALLKTTFLLHFTILQQNLILNKNCNLNLKYVRHAEFCHVNLHRSQKSEQMKLLLQNVKKGSSQIVETSCFSQLAFEICNEYSCLIPDRSRGSLPVRAMED